MKIYGNARSRAARVYWLLEEIGLPYEQIEVMQPVYKTHPDQCTSRDREFLRINPNGRIPAMDDNGLILWESFAINLHIARRYGAKLGPSDGEEEALMTMWSIWAVTECESNAIVVLRHTASLPLDQRRQDLADVAMKILRSPLLVLDNHLMGRKFLVGERMTVADINVAMIVNYLSEDRSFLQEFQWVSLWMNMLASRPAFRKIMAMRNTEG